MTKLCFDYDPLLYGAAAIGEQRSVKVVHRTSGRELSFKSRTDFYGHWKKKSGGYLAKVNEGRTTPWLPEDFDYFDVQEPEPIEFCVKSLKNMIQAVKEYAGATTYFGYSGRGTVFREDVSTIVKYKGNRDKAIRPIHLNGLKEYLVRHHNCIIVENPDSSKNVEADDMCSITSYESYRKWEKTKSDEDKVILVAIDKDYNQCAAHLLHPNNLDGVHSHDGGFGWLKVDESGKEKKVIGRGRLWLYFQIMNGDDADNYFANSAAPEIKWGQMSAYKVLQDAKNDKEAFEALVRGYKTLYPKPKKIIGWRGYEDQFERTILLPNSADFEIEVNWLYMLQENFTLALMLRKLGDKVDVKTTLDKLGVEYDV